MSGQGHACVHQDRTFLSWKKDAAENVVCVSFNGAEIRGRRDNLVASGSTVRNASTIMVDSRFLHGKEMCIGAGNTAAVDSR